MVGPDHLDANLPSQHASSSKQRLVFTEKGVGSIAIMTCMIASGNYALYFTGRTPLEGMAEKIEADTQKLVDKGRIYAHVGEGESQPLTNSDLLSWLVGGERVPVCGLIYDENRSWQEYLIRWMCERGVALIDSGDTMRALVMNQVDGQVYEFKPGRDPIRQPIQINQYSDVDAQRITLIPPKVEDCSPEMREMLQAQLDVLRGYLGSKKYATSVEYLSIYPFYTQKLLEKDYFPHESDLVQVGDEQLGVGIQVDTPSLDADLPSIQVSDANQVDNADIVVLDPESPDEDGASGIVINIPPESE